MPELILKLGDNVLHTYVFDKEVMSIGRSRDNDIVIENLSVSRNHARIRRQGNRYILTDLNSANGTYVNSVRVSKTEVVNNDIVTIGKHQLQFSNQELSEEEIAVETYSSDQTMLVERAPVGILCVIDGKLKGKEFQLTRFETSVGKASSNDIILGDDWFLSKKQATIRRRGSEFEIEDMGGFRKTKVNGRPVNQPSPLNNGDKIEFGNTRCLFQISTDGAALEPTGRIPEELGPEDSIFSSEMPEMEPVVQAAVDYAPVDQLPPGDQTPLESEIQLQMTTDRQSQSEEPACAAEQDAEQPQAQEGALSISELDDQVQLAELASINAAAVLTFDGGHDSSGDLAFSTAQFSAMPDDQQPDFEEVAALDSCLQPETDGEQPQPAEPASEQSEGETPLEDESFACLAQSLDEDSLVQQMPDEPASSEAAAQAEQEAQPAPEPETAQPAASNAPAAEEGSEFSKEIALWESALLNKSPVIRKQAAKTLKKLTGKDYAY